MPLNREPVVAACGEGTLEHLIGRAVLKGAQLLRLEPDTSRLLDNVLVRLCAGEPGHDDLALGFGPTFRAGYGGSGGAIFEGDLADALAWAMENGLLRHEEVDALLARAGSDLPAAALMLRGTAAGKAAWNS